MTEINATKGAIDLADEMGILIDHLTGTGKNGKITIDDVKAEIAKYEINEGEESPQEETAPAPQKSGKGHKVIRNFIHNSEKYMIDDVYTGNEAKTLIEKGLIE